MATKQAKAGALILFIIAAAIFLYGAIHCHQNSVGLRECSEIFSSYFLIGVIFIFLAVSFLRGGT